MQNKNIAVMDRATIGVVFMEQITPIETEYNDYLFRSRLEARWAVFFDALGIPYVYEPDGFRVNGRLYLPDFYLPSMQLYAEIKGVMPEKHYCEMLMNFRTNVNSILLLVGVPQETNGIFYGWGNDKPCTLPTRFVCHREAGLESLVGLRNEPQAKAGGKPLECFLGQQKRWRLNQRPLKAAVQMARRMRFEHGESKEKVRRVF